jgi:hypothetical protein
MSKDNSDYKKSLLPYKKGGSNNIGRPGPLEDRNQEPQKSENQKAGKKSKK